MVTRGKVFQNDHIRIVIKYDNTLKNPKYAVIVPNNLAKTAVARNLLRRKVYSLVTNYIVQSPTAYVCIYPKKINSSTEELKQALKDLICSKK